MLALIEIEKLTKKVFCVFPKDESNAVAALSFPTSHQYRFPGLDDFLIFSRPQSRIAQTNRHLANQKIAKVLNFCQRKGLPCQSRKAGNRSGRARLCRKDFVVTHATSILVGLSAVLDACARSVLPDFQLTIQPCRGQKMHI